MHAHTFFVRGRGQPILPIPLGEGQSVDWFQPNKANRIRFRAMMESGQFVDEVADIVQTQVIAHKARASIRNRDAVRGLTRF